MIDDRTLGAKSREHLEAIVAIASDSDESSDTIPSTEGQRVLAAWLEDFFAGLGCTVERDAFANIIATLPGRGAGAEAAPIALMVHLDTARGTAALPELICEPAWDGRPLRYPANAALTVSTETYPAVGAFVGGDVLHGPGDAPFGLDDKLGLSHLMTLAWLLQQAPADHPPLCFVGRPDEEIGRMEAVEGLAETLSARGVTTGWTVDGIWPFEVNVENFNAAQGSLVFEAPPALAATSTWTLHLGGVNTHGATAEAEGHRAATRLAAELAALLDPAVTEVQAFTSDALRDCDAVVVFGTVGDGSDLRGAVDAVMTPHLPRGASFRLEAGGQPGVGAAAMLAFVARFLRSEPGWPLAAEHSSGRQGYSHPYRARPTDRGLQLDVRIRDFDEHGLVAREDHLRDLAGDRLVDLHRQYVNMGPALGSRPELVSLPERAAARVGVPITVQPIRGGTGVDPFLDRGIGVGNLGTGYFAPESEKELTSVQLMAQHVRWLYALVQCAC